MPNYHVYSNGGSGPVNYDVPIATTTGLAWTSGPLAAPGSWEFGVRAFDATTGLEELNRDASVSIVLDAAGRDITDLPASPAGLRAFPTAAGTARVEWPAPPRRGSAAPTTFRVYRGVGGTPDYTAPVAVVPASSARANVAQATLTGLVGGTSYTVAVRAANASGEGPSSATATFTASTAGPAPVGSLTATAIT